MEIMKVKVEVEIATSGFDYEAKEDLYDMLPKSGEESGVTEIRSIKITNL